MNYEDLAKQASEKAYSPYSKIKVGAVVLTDNNEHFLGCNVENASFGATVCAERNAIFQAVAAGHTSINHVYVYSDKGFPPCGLCRQVIKEFSHEKTKVTIIDSNFNKKTINFSELLPHSFNKDFLD
ncbi:MAG: cytidine deaminase [Bacteriovoracaceae bacterium]